MKKNIFIATIKIAFESEDEGSACDAVSAMMNDLSMPGANNEEPAILDWQYEASPDYDERGPHEIGEKETEGLQEGEIFANPPFYGYPKPNKTI